MTDVELDERVTVLEENGGDNGLNGTKMSYWNTMWVELLHEFQNALSIYILDTIAFHTVLTSLSSISTGSAVTFNEVLLNLDDG